MPGDPSVSLGRLMEEGTRERKSLSLSLSLDGQTPEVSPIKSGSMNNKLADQTERGSDGGRLNKTDEEKAVWKETEGRQ